MAEENWAHIRLSVTLHPSRMGALDASLHWRLEAKPPSGDWTMRHTVAFGAERVEGLGWPPSRDDMLAAMTEVLMGIRWTAEGAEPPF